MTEGPGDAFDHHSEGFAGAWRSQVADMRVTCPVTATAAHGGYVAVTRFADATAVLRDAAAFSADRTVRLQSLDAALDGTSVRGGVTIPRNPVRMGMMEMDPPEHTAYRKALTPWFSARAIEAEVPRLRALVDWSLDRVCELGTMDVVADLSHVLPGIVTLDVLGLPLDRFSGYGEALGGAAYYEPGSERALRGVLSDLGDLVAAARRTGVDRVAPTLLQRLVAEPVGGKLLEDAMIVELLFMLLNGGFDTSSALIAHLVVHLDAVPADRERLQADRSLVPLAVDELLRYYSPATGVARTAVADTVIGETTVRAGERILVLLGAANTDPEKFTRAGDFVVDREPNSQISFGSGVHRCIGSFLARTEMMCLLEAVLDRMPDLRVERAGVLSQPTAPLVHGYKQLPVTFTPTLRRQPATVDGLPAARAARHEALSLVAP